MTRRPAGGAPSPRPGPRLPELELECMKVLWEGGDFTVRAVRERLLPRRPLAYTTVLTLLDRLAHKGAVTRKKAGRAHLYRALYSLNEAQEAAVTRLLEHYFAGSPQLLIEHLRVMPPPARAARVAAADAATDQLGELDPTLL